MVGSEIGKGGGLRLAWADVATSDVEEDDRITPNNLSNDRSFRSPITSPKITSPLSGNNNLSSIKLDLSRSQGSKIPISNNSKSRVSGSHSHQNSNHASPRKSGGGSRSRHTRDNNPASPSSAKSLQERLSSPRHR